MDGCEDDCLIQNCTACQANTNTVCTKCIDGFYVNNTGMCAVCTFSNCILCSSAYCQECSIGYYLSSNGLNCSKIVCKTGFLFDGY